MNYNMMKFYNFYEKVSISDGQINVHNKKRYLVEMAALQPKLNWTIIIELLVLKKYQHNRILCYGSSKGYSKKLEEKFGSKFNERILRGFGQFYSVFSKW